MINYNKKVIAIIVTYNRVNIFKECITALTSQKYHTDILVVNNNSTDGTIDFLNDVKFEFPNNKFYIHNLNENLNGAGGFNYGLKMAVKLDYDYFWIMDDDCIVKDNSLLKLIEADAKLNGQYGFLSSKVEWIDGSICKTNVQRVSVARRINDFSSELVKVDFASFVSLFVKKENVLRVGFPIKEFVIWTDDLEWTRRLTSYKLNKCAKAGYLCNNSVVIHKTKYNNGVTIVTDTYDRIYRYKYIYRNDVYCFKREGIRGHIYIFIRNFYHILKVLLFSKNDKIYKTKMIVKGYIDGFTFNPKVEY